MFNFILDSVTGEKYLSSESTHIRKTNADNTIPKDVVSAHDKHGNLTPDGLNIMTLENAIIHQPNKVKITADWHLFKEERYRTIWPTDKIAEKERATQEMIQIINRDIHDGDILLFLGDIGESEFNDIEIGRNKMTQFIKELRNKCGKMYMLIGNNDVLPINYYKEMGFDVVFTNPISCEELNVVFSHEPYNLEKYNSDWINIHGHIHGSKHYWNMDWKRHIDVYPRINNNRILTYPEYMKLYSTGIYDGDTVIMGPHHS